MILRKVLLTFLLVAVAFGVVVHDTSRYQTPIRRLSGKVIGFGDVNPDVRVEVYDNAQVWLDNSISVVEKRKQQSRIATTRTDKRGRFEFKGLPKGFYEVEFSREGWDVLSVLLNVEPNGAATDSLCVTLRIEGASGQNSVEKCNN